jgi:signal transduction histidine kinase
MGVRVCGQWHRHRSAVSRKNLYRVHSAAARKFREPDRATICQRVVQRYDGRIWVSSQLGQGATFFFTLPAA